MGITLIADASAAPAAQAPAAGVASRVVDFGTLVARYRLGQFDAAVEEILTHTGREVADAGAPPTDDAARAPRAAGFDAAAIALLVEAACRSSPDWNRQWVLTGAVAPRLAHSWHRLRSPDVDLELGRHASGGDRPGPAFVRLAYMAAISCAQGLPGNDVASLLAGEALNRFPDDPDLLLARGSSAEFRAWVLARERIRPTDGMDRPTFARWGSWLAHAEDDYTQALKLEPTLAEAHLRLGRLRWMQDRSRDARQHLERAHALAKGPYIRYLAALFAGAVHERDARWGDARAAYLSALGIAERAQSPVFALAALDLRQGRAREARLRIDAWFAALARAEPLDPFFLYDFGQYWQINGYLSQLRRTVSP